MSTPTLVLAGLLLLPQQSADVRLDAVQLVAQAQKWFPSYEGDHKYFLTATERREVSAGIAILEASLALEPNNAFALGWRGFGEVLLGEDDKNRGAAEQAEEHFDAALAAYDRAIVLQPSFYWAHYARGMAEWNRGRWWSAIENYGEAVRLTNDVMGDGQVDDAGRLDAHKIRFKARRWLADARMRVFDFEGAREEFRSFYADNGNNQFDLGRSLAETHLRERDWAGTLQVYENILTVEEFRPFPAPYEWLGYLSGLTGENAAGAEWIERSFEHEFTPKFYPRLWLWILAPEPKRSEVAADLSEYLDFPPDDVSEWDRALGRFVLGEGTPEAFLRVARAEEERRKREAIKLDDLMCEVWFYVGLRREADLPTEAGEERTAGLLDALAAYGASLALETVQFKWEWAYARLGYARVANELGLGPDARLVGNRNRLRDEAARLARHRPGEERTHSGLGAMMDLRPGDLVRYVHTPEPGVREAVQEVVRAQLP